MSKISLDLSSIKSAGIYTIEIDESQRTETQINALRLAVGFAGKGTFNRPVFLQTETMTDKIYGSVDSKLEQKGCFFNRNIRTMLNNGPVLALNLLKVDDSFTGPDQVNYTTLSLDAGKKNPTVKDPGVNFGEYDYLAESIDNEVYGTQVGSTIPFVGAAPYASLFDRSRFWIPSEQNLMNVAAVGLGTGTTGTFEKSNFINFANCGTDEISLLVFKPEGFTGYDITAKEWYGGDSNIPYGWIRPSDYISDYFIRVVAVKGNWSNCPNLSASSTWGKYFDKKGLLKDKIYQFSQAEGITFIGSWTGSIIPNFTDKKGNYLYIKDRVNAQSQTTGLLMNINEDAMQVISYDLNGIDLATGEATGTGSWIYDYDGNAEGDSDAGETEIGTNGFKIDMVGHGFQDGVRGEMAPVKLEKTFSNVIFDGSTGILAHGDTVYYMDSAKVPDVTKEKNYTTIKIPKFSDLNYTGSNKIAGLVLKLYAVKNEKNVGITTDYKYVALSEDYASTLTTATDAHTTVLSGLTLYNKYGDTSTGKASSLTGKLKVVMPAEGLLDNTLYNTTDILYGNYISYNNSSVHVYTVESSTSGTVVEEVMNTPVAKLKTDTWTISPSTTGTDVYKFNYNNITYGLSKTGTVSYYMEQESDIPDTFGINFLSYNFVTKDAEDVLANITKAYYFNGRKNNSDATSPVSIIDTSLFGSNTPVSADTLNMFIITDADSASKITVGDFVENITFHNLTGEATKYGIIPGMTRITKKIFVNLTADNKFTYKGTKYTFSSASATPITTGTGKRGFYLFTAVDPVLISKDDTIKRQLPISNEVISKSLRFIPLKGLHISSRHKPGFDENGRISINEGIKKIYSVLEDDGIHRGLCNPNMVDYRYIVDTMGYGIDNEMGGKVYLSRLAQDRGKTTALLNAPSKHQFEMSSDPCFCPTYDSDQYVKPAFDTKYVADGGNPDMYNTKQFTLPTEANGSKFTAVFYPYFIYKDNGREILVPPAADVSNTFVSKFSGGDPYAITANMNGIIRNGNIKGVEYDVDETDRNYLEPIGINSIIKESGTIKIYGNQTAYQDTKSDFNKLHVREDLNTMEIAADNILKIYNFKYNTPQTRASIQTALTPLMEAMKLSQAIDAYNIVCDETNNTEEIIQNDFGIVDIEVYFNHGMEKIVQRIRVRKHSDIPVTE